MTKPWNTVSWRRKREELIQGKQCEWCGSTDTLVIDHNQNFDYCHEYDNVLYTYFTEYFQKEKNKEEYDTLRVEASKGLRMRYYDACIKCGYSVKARKALKPKFKCYKCKIEFDKPRKKIHPTIIEKIERRMLQSFKKKHIQEINERFNHIRQKSNEDYLAFKDVTILCKKCNFARLKSQILCKKCKEHYHKEQFEMCFHCYSQTSKGKQTLYERKQVTLKHPWCQKEYSTERQWLDFEFNNPLLLCIHCCETNPNDCQYSILQEDY